VLLLAVAPTAALAQSLVCHAIRRGDTASHVAQRLTGSGRNKYQPWFQIMAPSGSFIPKSQYDRVRPGWRACVVTRAISPRSRKATQVALADSSAAAQSSEAVVASAAAEVSAATEATEAVEEPRGLEASGTLATVGASGSRVDLTVIWLGAAVAVPWFGWRILDDVLDRRRRAAFARRHFADRFVREFERPLIQHHAAEPAVRVRLRSRWFGRRFEILLAPGTSRRYPNLSDHKQNVEYDVTRVLQALADESVVNGPLHAHAEWVVVPFQFKKVGPKHRV
jgi:3D (Asp-Asp-Asp) domain-containing protein